MKVVPAKKVIGYSGSKGTLWITTTGWATLAAAEEDAATSDVDEVEEVEVAVGPDSAAKLAAAAAELAELADELLALAAERLEAIALFEATKWLKKYAI